MHRLFVALPLPESITDQLVDLSQGPDSLRWVHADSLHLTLRFIGEVDGNVAEDVAASLNGIRAEPFDLRLDGVGHFSHRRHGALWAGIAPRAPIAALAQRADRAVQSAGIPPETRAFTPHITLARWSGPAPDVRPWLERHGGLSSMPWRVDQLVLFESHLTRAGPHYEPALTVPLGR